MTTATTTSIQQPDTARRGHALRGLLARTPVLPVLLIIALIGFTLANDRFIAPTNLVALANQASYLVIISLGQALVLISGGFDLSVGPLVGLTSVVTALTLVATGGSVVGGLLAMLLALLVCVVAGAINGLSVAFLNIPPFIVTLAIATGATGLAHILSNGVPVLGIPDWYLAAFGTGSLTSLSTPIYLTALIVAVVWVVVSHTRAGRRLYAVGGNARAARLSGIQPTRVLLGVYVVSSLLAGIAGLLMTARVGTGDSNLGGDFVMQSITAAVIGGVSLRGGEGRIGGVLAGALFVAVVANGMNLARVQSYYQMLVLGALLMLTVVIEQLRRRWFSPERRS